MAVAVPFRGDWSLNGFVGKVVRFSFKSWSLLEYLPASLICSQNLATKFMGFYSRNVILTSP